MAQSSKWTLLLRSAQQYPVTPLLSPIMFHMTCPSHSSWFDHPNNIPWEVQIMKLLINSYKCQSKNHHRYLHNSPILAHHYLIWKYDQNLGAFYTIQKTQKSHGNRSRLSEHQSLSGIQLVLISIKASSCCMTLLIPMWATSKYGRCSNFLHTAPMQGHAIFSPLDS